MGFREKINQIFSNLEQSDRRATIALRDEMIKFLERNRIKVLMEYLDYLMKDWGDLTPQRRQQRSRRLERAFNNGPSGPLLKGNFLKFVRGEAYLVSPADYQLNEAGNIVKVRERKAAKTPTTTAEAPTTTAEAPTTTAEAPTIDLLTLAELKKLRKADLISHILRLQDVIKDLQPQKIEAVINQ